MSRAMLNYPTELLKIVLALPLTFSNFISGIRQHFTNHIYFRKYTDLHADNEIPKDFFYKEVFRP